MTETLTEGLLSVVMEKKLFFFQSWSYVKRVLSKSGHRSSDWKSEMTKEVLLNAPWKIENGRVGHWEMLMSTLFRKRRRLFGFRNLPIYQSNIFPTELISVSEARCLSRNTFEKCTFFNWEFVTLMEEVQLVVFEENDSKYQDN